MLGAQSVVNECYDSIGSQIFNYLHENYELLNSYLYEGYELGVTDMGTSRGVKLPKPWEKLCTDIFTHCSYIDRSLNNFTLQPLGREPTFRFDGTMLTSNLPWS